MKEVYKRISYFLLIVVTVYVGVGQWLIASHANIDNRLLSFFTGSPRLVIRHNVLALQLKTDSDKLELHFRKPLVESVTPLYPKNDDLIYDVKMSVERDWITIKADDGKSLQNVPLALILSDPSKAGYIAKRYVKAVRVDNAEHSILGLYKNLLSLSNSNVDLYYPFQWSNLSSFLADTIGGKFVFLIVSSLLVLFLCQLFLFAVSIVWQPEEVKDYFDDAESGTAVTILDNIANNFAIPLGFLGTAVSVWCSLEGAEADYRSFVQILEIIKIAIFTTVLGLTIKILCIVRGHYRGIFPLKYKKKGQ